MEKSGTKISAFALTGVIGFILAGVLGLVLVCITQLNELVYLAIAATSALTFFFTAIVTKIILGFEDYVFYRHFILCGIAVCIVPLIAAVPVLPYLDIYITAFGLFHFFGRMACFFAGCCYGRPSKLGISYSHKGFPSYLIGVKLFPIQLTEASGLLLITVTSVFILITNQVPGTALISYVVMYSSLRYILEFIRGDIGRKYFAMFSEAQWTSVVLLICVLFLHFNQALDLPVILLIVATLILASILPTYFLLRRTSLRIYSAAHIQEIGHILTKHTAQGLTSANAPLTISTSLGIRIAISKHLKEHEAICHCSLSYCGTKQRETIIKKTFALIYQLKFAGQSFTKFEGQNGVTHFVINNSAQ